MGLLDRFRKKDEPRGLVPLHSCGLMLSYRCQLACRHCLYACGPGWRDWMSAEQVTRLLEGVREVWRHPRGVHFSGGEPFLRFDLLRHAVREAVRLSMPIEYVETSGSWFHDDDASRAKLRALYEAGLRRLLISVSPFHAEVLPLARSVSFIEAACGVFGRGRVLIYQHQWLKLLAGVRLDPEGKRPIPLRRWVERHGVNGAGKLLWHGYRLIAGGRCGLELAGLARCWRATHFEGQGCRMELFESGHAHFDPYGNYIPSFCGGISLGKADDLPSFVGGFDPAASVVVSTLAEEGPYGLVRLAGQRYGFRPDQKGYAAKCHLCVAVRRHLALKSGAAFPELAPLAFYERLRTRKKPLDL